MFDERPPSLQAPVRSEPPPTPGGGGSILRLRATTMALLVALLVQYAIGITVNLKAQLPAPKPGAGAGKGIATALSEGVPLLVAHVAVGIILLIGALALVAQAARSGHRLILACSIVGLICVWIAFFTGGTFVSNGDDNASLVMALLAGAAILSYLIALYANPGAGRNVAPDRPVSAGRPPEARPAVDPRTTGRRGANVMAAAAILGVAGIVLIGTIGIVLGAVALMLAVPSAREPGVRHQAVVAATLGAIAVIASVTLLVVGGNGLLY